MKRTFRFILIGILLGLLAVTALAADGPQVMSISCKEPNPEAQSGLHRVKGDSDTWTFQIALEDGARFVKGPFWDYPGKGGNDPDWGLWTGGEDGTSSLGWSSPEKTGSFSVGVHGQIACGNGGGGAPIDFAASWDGDVIYYEYSPQNKAKNALGDLMKGALAPPEPSGTSKNLKVFRGQRLTFSTTWSDTDSRRLFGIEDEWKDVPGVGPYTITISSNNPEVFVDENKELNTKEYQVEGGYYIQSPNMHVYVGTEWDRQPFTITVSISDDGDVPEGSIGTVRDTAPTNHTRNFVNAGPYIPKKLTFLTSLSDPNAEGTHTNPAWKPFRNYYRADPASPREADDPPAEEERPYYESQVVDEHFVMSPRFSLSDLDDNWIIDNGVGTAQEAFNKLFSSIYTTSFLIFDQGTDKDIIYDPHSLALQASQITAFKSSAYTSGVIGYNSTQTYTGESNRVLAVYTVNMSYNPTTQEHTLEKVRIGG